jgi:hypothetical protein
VRESLDPPQLLSCAPEVELHTLFPITAKAAIMLGSVTSWRLFDCPLKTTSAKTFLDTFDSGAEVALA